ncbi:MAG: gliding motility-associated C-terminal domain-containing protein [Flavobacteriales bacterium]|jgi:gliding motility-associated-like protein
MFECVRLNAILLFVGLSSLMHGQCIVINEVLVNAAGDCDGSCVPSTAEWLELHNTCSDAVNVGCYFITDGDFSVTFPSNTVIPGNGFLVIGSLNSGVDVDINLAFCNCTSGADGEIGIFTNGNEQIALVNPAGQIIDGIYWGTGQFSQTPTFTTDALFGCPSQTIALSASNAAFTQVPMGGDGQTVYRSCEDSEVWLADGANYTPGAANGDNTGGSLVITASDNSPCEGESVSLTVLGAAGGVTWNTGSTDQIITVNADGTYTATLNSASGCGSSASITVNFQEGPAVDAGQGGLADCEDGLQLHGFTGADVFFWEPTAGLSDPNTLSPIASPTVTTIYTLHALEGDCESTATATVVPECGDLKVPNVFTPNNDGLNDVFRPDGKGIADYSLQIFNRWGVLVFESLQYNSGWNGKINNEPAPAGTYYFLLMAKDGLGNSLVGSEVLEGEVTLIR